MRTHVLIGIVELGCGANLETPAGAVLKLTNEVTNAGME